MKAILRFSTLLTAALLPSLPAVAADTVDVAALRDQVRALEQQLKVLARQIELKDEAATEAAKKTAIPTAEAAGFSLGSPDKAFRLNLRVLAQADGRAFLNKKTIPGTTTAVAQDTFLLRRIRPIVAGTVGNIYEFAIVPEFAGGDATASSPVIQDAWVSGKLSPALTLKAGKFTTPIVLEPGANRAFIESPFVNTLAPNRDLGVEALGALGGYVDYRLGVYNGQRNNTAGFVRDGDNDKVVAGRLTVTPFKGGFSFFEPLALGLGFSGGRDKGAAGSALQNPVTNAQQSLLNFGTLTADGRHYRLSPSVSVYSGAVSFVGEYIWEKQTLRQGAVLFDTANTAWRANVGYVLTGEDSTARGVTPREDFKPGSGGWGAFEVVARASGIDFDDDLFLASKGNLANSATNANATGAKAYGAGLNWFLSRNLTLLLNYEYTTFSGRTTRPVERAVFTRAQINF
ncbi:MAG: porin [Verrucomicrobia bacterium]|nr:porin [Verrucomicrobiota bacterium]